MMKKLWGEMKSFKILFLACLSLISSIKSLLEIVKFTNFDVLYCVFLEYAISKRRVKS